MVSTNRVTAATRRFGLVASMAVGALFLMPVAANAAPATTSVTVGTQYGSTLRASFWVHGDFSGYIWNSYGSGNCTSTTADADYSQTSLGDGWDNDIESAKDFNGCDIRIYDNPGFTGQFYSGYVSCGSGGCNGTVFDSWGARNRTESYRLS